MMWRAGVAAAEREVQRAAEQRWRLRLRLLRLAGQLALVASVVGIAMAVLWRRRRLCWRRDMRHGLMKLQCCGPDCPVVWCDLLATALQVLCSD